nr:immunoglobulin heavy chain junction region [Mus musculus]NSM03996.1 immunoglobulin heavy chain junction region [Mus musculus]NSM04531.1 immunoglobulin heavy chain junction region [Mus musculus]NSM05280.1 immunoglobulin heavy chain junction region [Mus musculus]NSM05408.1 immunoglobulin heavy chain junction region [Mus musculus]
CARAGNWDYFDYW